MNVNDKKEKILLCLHYIFLSELQVLYYTYTYMYKTDGQKTSL